MERFLVIYSLLRKIQLFPVSTLENVRRYQLESLPRERRNCAREYISSMKIGKRRKDCMRFENSGRTIFIPSIRKIERSNFYSQQFFLHWEEYSQECLETDLFSLYRKFYFLYIFIYIFFLLPVFLREGLLTKIANVLSVFNAFTTDIRYTLYLPTFFEFAPHHVSHISSQCLSQI